MFHGLDEARMKVQNIQAIKQAKSWDTVKGVCERTRKFVQGNDKYDIESIVILEGTNDLRHKNVTPESLIFQLRSEIQKLQVIYDGRLFICKITQLIDIEFVDRKITVFNEFLENEISHSFNNVDLIETIPRELKLFNLKDGLHLNKKHGCKALAEIILKSLYAKLRPEACKTGGRKNFQNKASHQNVNRNRNVKSNEKGSRSSDGRP